MESPPNHDAPARRLPRIAVIVPAYNEEANIAKAIASLHEVQRSCLHWEWLTVVINDGSTDRTGVILKNLRRAIPLTVVELPFNVGIGAAVQTGFQVAVQWEADVAIQFDGDLQHPAGGIPELVAPVLAGRSDVLVGSRYVPGAGGSVSNRARRIGTWLLSHLLWLLVQVKVQDVTSGFRAFNREAMQFISGRYADDYPEVETYVPLARNGFRVEEVPVKMNQRAGGVSSISALRSAYYMVKVILAVFIQLIEPGPRRRRSSAATPHPSAGAVHREP